jgi:hypothetical protein
MSFNISLLTRGKARKKKKIKGENEETIYRTIGSTPRFSSKKRHTLRLGVAFCFLVISVFIAFQL